MNVSVQEHQRNILAAMGIDLWIPKTIVPVQQVHSQLYRDLALQEQATNQQFETDIQTTLPIQSKVAKQIVQIEKKSEVAEISEEIIVDEVKPLVADVNQTTSIEKIPAFELQIFCLEHCAILVDVSQIQAEQQKLWINIQNALVGEYFDLKWPFPVPQFQDARGAELFIQGFLAAHQQDKVLLTLGEIPYLNKIESIQLASLQEMIERPILKRRLWKFMQKTE